MITRYLFSSRRQVLMGTRTTRAFEGHDMVKDVVDDRVV